MGSAAKIMLLIAAFHFWDLQAETEPEIHFAELKIKRQDEHKRVKREQFCQVLCLPNWTLYNDTCYRALQIPRTWIGAEIYCQQLVPGGHLATLHSLGTTEFLVKLASRTLSATYIWVGASGQYKKDTFFWTDGSQWDYFKWHKYDFSVGDCVQLICVGADIYTVRIWYCSTIWTFICQYKPEFD